eukprot:COSAG02_NODE_61185_length_269_cov_0.623529_1_plen_25_part_10
MHFLPDATLRQAAFVRYGSVARSVS